MSRLALFLLGPPRIEHDGEPISVDRRKALALIIYLAVTGRSHSRDALATLFWPQLDQSRARAGLRRALAALKKALSEGFADSADRSAVGHHPLDVDRETVGLNPDAEVWLDVNEFQDRLAACRAHDHPQDEVCPACLPLLTEATELYRDDFLAGFTLPDSPAFDEWQFFQSEGLLNELASALERLARGHSIEGEFEPAIAHARRWLALDPLHEPAHRCLIRLYAWSGQRAAALRQYAECERVLREELGVPPEEETAQVYRAIKERRELPPPEETYRRVERFAVVNRIARTVGTALDLDDVFEVVRREITSVFQPDAFCIGLYDEEADELSFPVQACEGIREHPRRQSLGTGLLSLVVTEKKPLLIGDLEQEQDRLPAPQVWGTKPSASWLGVPMLAGGRVLGVICVQAYRAHAYGEKELLLLSTIADQIIFALENARLFQEERAQRELAVALEEVAAAFIRMSDLEQMLDYILEQVERVVGGDACNIMLIKGTIARVECWRGYEHLGTEDRISHFFTPVTDYPHLMKMTQSGKPVVIPDTAADPDWISREGWEWLRSYVGAPIQARGGEIEGILNVDGSRPGQFSPADAERLVAFTDHAAAAIENARLYQYTVQLEQADRAAAPVSPQPSARKHNLPVQLTPFVGREAVLAEIADRLQDPDCRLLTLVGPGGSGKTRLALEAAAARIDDYAHGVWFVSLAPLQSVEAIVPTVAEAIGFRFYEEGLPQQQLLDYLRQKSLLLIMDNYEHLPEGTGLVTEILKTASNVKVLATSRARLNVGGEHRFQITGMDFPKLPPKAPADAVQYSAVKLFLQGARRAQPSFELTDENLGGVVDVCRIVEGMPLAIRLAAAWVEMLAPAEIAAEISQSLDFLETDLRDVPERQRSMRAVFDHSWNLLTGREREVFQGLSVFRGGFTRDAAQEVTGASLRELMALANKSLLQRTSTGRYEVHELLRQYVAERLGQSPVVSKVVHDRHSTYYTAALQEWGEDLEGPREQTALAEMDAEIENARAAWDWAVEQGQVERLDQAIDGLLGFYWSRQRGQMETVCRLAAEKLATTTFGDGLRVLAKILTYQSSEIFGTERARQLLWQSLALLEGSELADQDTRLERALVLGRMGGMIAGSDCEKARQLVEQSLALYQELGDRGGIARSLQALGGIALHQGRLEEGEHLVRESLVIRQELGNRGGIASGLITLGVALLKLGKYAEAHSVLKESAVIYNERGFKSSLASSLLHEAARLSAELAGERDEG